MSFIFRKGVGVWMMGVVGTNYNSRMGSCIRTIMAFVPLPSTILSLCSSCSSKLNLQISAYMQLYESKEVTRRNVNFLPATPVDFQHVSTNRLRFLL